MNKQVWRSRKTCSDFYCFLVHYL